MNTYLLFIAASIPALLACVFVWRSKTHIQTLLVHTQNEHLTALQQYVTQSALLTQKQLEDMRKTVHDRLQDITGSMSTRLQEQHKVMSEVHTQLGGLAETAKHMHVLGKDIAGLQHVLKAPKLRGQLGETLLEDMLQQVLPKESFRLQHRFNNTQAGTTSAVDAAILLGEKWVPIDCKFPLETYQRLIAEDVASNTDDYKKRKRAFLDTLRKHIVSVAEKYIRPEHNTYDFALVYLPAESLYYESVVRTDPSDPTTDMLAFASQHKIVLVSPNTFYAYLLTVAYGLKGLHIEEQAHLLRGQLTAFQKKFSEFQKNIDKTTRHIELAYKQTSDLQRQSQHLSDHVDALTQQPSDHNTSSDTSTPTGQ